MIPLLKRFASNECGATAIEYALIAICICVAIVAIVDGLGLKTNSSFTAVASAFQ